MTEERTVTVDGQVYTVVISDEYEALLAASAAGRAILGLWDSSRSGVDLSPATYLAERLEDVDEEYLEQVVRRRFGLPWKIAETKRLVVREFCLKDAGAVLAEEKRAGDAGIFDTRERLEEYIRCQYGFYQYGLWALVRKADGKIVGKAGLTDFLEGLELGYHIYEPYRGEGYGLEACREILNWSRVYQNCPVYAKIDASNEASIRLACACGFQLIQKKYTEAGRCLCLYSWNC